MRKIVIFDSQELICSGIKAYLLQHFSDTEITIFEEYPAKLLTFLKENHTDLLIYEPASPELSNLEIEIAIRQMGIETITICYTSDFSQWRQLHHLRAGAHSVVCKYEPLDHFLYAVECALSGKIYHPQTKINVLIELARYYDELKQISQREVNILELMAEGLCAKEIGQKLEITTNTVNWYKKNILNRFEVTNETKAVAIAFRTGLIK